jgi:hypothetical protein
MSSIPFSFGTIDFLGVINCMKMTRTEIQRRYRAKHPEKVREVDRRYRKLNGERVRDIKAASRRRRYAANKAKIQEYKAKKGCFKCFMNTVCCLEFHHRDPFTKEHQISDMLDVAWPRIEAEMAKCEVVCRNCHAIIHDEKLGDELPPAPK